MLFVLCGCLRASSVCDVQRYKKGDIFLAFKHFYLSQVDECLSNGADVNEEDSNKWTLLMLAISRPDVLLVDLVVNRKADVNHTSADGKFPLYLAAVLDDKYRYRFCQVLTNAGADKTKTYLGKTASQWALEKGHHDAFSLLVCVCVVVCFFLMRCRNHNLRQHRCPHQYNCRYVLLVDFFVLLSSYDYFDTGFTGSVIPTGKLCRSGLRIFLLFFLHSQHVFLPRARV